MHWHALQKTRIRRGNHRCVCTTATTVLIFAARQQAEQSQQVLCSRCASPVQSSGSRRRFSVKCAGLRGGLTPVRKSPSSRSKILGCLNLSERKQHRAG